MSLFRKRISRRDLFRKTAQVGAAGALGAGLVGAKAKAKPKPKSLPTVTYYASACSVSCTDELGEFDFSFFKRADE